MADTPVATAGELLPVIEGTVSAVSAVNTALNTLKKGLYSVKVSKHDATELQRKLEGELFDKWEEGFEFMDSKGIAIGDIKEFLDHMQEAYEGIDDSLRKKMDGIKWAAEWSYKIYEFKYNKTGSSGARYGMVAFGKSADKQTIDCMYVLYKMDFKVAPKEIVTKKKHSAMLGLINWTTTDTKLVEQTLGIKSIKLLQNFFRLKALQGFYKEGLIESINYVPSIDDIDS